MDASLTQSDGHYVIRVRDTGVGIPPEAGARVFDRFFRVDKARSRAESGSGAGLGLAIARWIAEAHEGRLELTASRPGDTVFSAILPTSDGANA